MKTSGVYQERNEGNEMGEQTGTKKKLTKSEKKVILIMSITGIVAAIIFAVILFINDYYKATEKALKAILGEGAIEVTETDDYYLFTKSPLSSYAGIGEGKGIIFYPGGKVDEVAYAPILSEFAAEGYDVYLVKMPARLAMFGMNKAEAIMESATDVQGWTMMGHSLGGAMAAAFCASHDEEVDNLVLLAAYSMEDISELDIDVYSFYGSEDKVLNMDNYEKYYENLPEDTVETVIEGGNHAYYGHYGEQDGDGTATISREEQQTSVLDVFLTLEKWDD